MTEINFQQVMTISVMLACLPAGYTLVSGSSSSGCVTSNKPIIVAKLLQPYGIEPRVHKMSDGKPARGYSRDDCKQAFTMYLSDVPPKNALAKCNSVTTLANIDQNAVFENVTGGAGYTCENAVSANKDAAGYGVTLQNVEKEAMLL